MVTSSYSSSDTEADTGAFSWVPRHRTYHVLSYIICVSNKINAVTKSRRIHIVPNNFNLKAHDEMSYLS